MHIYLDKQILVILSKGLSFAPDAKGAPHQLKVSGVLRGFDMFNNLILENAIDESQPGVKTEMGEIVRSCSNNEEHELLYTEFLLSFCGW
jgi:LSM domain